jgi:aspartyl-tRNA(Asn)/glutamyl-tRNA(Gln) amidotransferase subunit A
MTINDLVSRIKQGETTARAEVERALEAIKTHEDRNVFLSVTAERALERADDIDARIKAGKGVGRLAGVPFAAKDNFLTFGGTTTAASKILENFKAPLQATAIEKLEAEGAICIGKTNLDAFAHGGSTENSAFGPTMNAFDKSKVAGGSSGGSAVATALGIVPFALGSDTGGSIRQPASFNGVVGIKPTYGTISRYGVVAMASSTDVVGCFTNNVEDAELVMDIMAGRDASDMTTLPDFFYTSSCKADSKNRTHKRTLSGWC